VLTGRRHRDHIANLDVRVGDDHAVNEEFNQLPLLFPGCLLKAALHPGTEGFHGLRERGQIVLPLCFRCELIFLAHQGLQVLLQALAPSLILLAAA